jgi:hypothetical protein
MDRSTTSQSLPSERIGESDARKVQIDPAASAALAEAIRSARQEVKPVMNSDSSAQPGASALTSRHVWKSAFLPQAAAALLLVGAGWFASHAVIQANDETIHHMETDAARSREILTKLTEDLAALKNTMASTRDVEHTASTASVADQAKLTATIERLTVALQEPSKKLASLEERLGRMEGQIAEGLSAAKTTASAAVSAASDPDNPPILKPVRTDPVEGWVLREVYNGSALVESRSRGLYEVMPGNVIPGVGRVEAIERRGTRWVVVTDKGFIGAYR